MFERAKFAAAKLFARSAMLLLPSEVHEERDDQPAMPATLSPVAQAMLESSIPIPREVLSEEDAPLPGSVAARMRGRTHR